MSTISYLVVYNGHSGKFVKIPKPIRFHTFNEFKQFVASSFAIDDAHNLFLLTLFGIRLNFTLINEVADVYVFDRQLFAAPLMSATALPEGVDLLILTPIAPPPEPLARKGWARAILFDCQQAGRHISEVTKQINAMFTGVNILFQFGTNYTDQIDKESFAPKFAEVVGLNERTLAQLWITHYEKLKRFPQLEFGVDEDGTPKHKLYLHQLLNYDQLAKAAQKSIDQLPGLISKFNQLNETYQRCLAENTEIDATISELRRQSRQLFRDFDANATISAIETVDDVNVIYADAVKLYEHYIAALEFKNKLSRSLTLVFQRIATVQMKMVEIKQAVSLIDLIGEIQRCENLLALCIDLPLLFGSVLIEKRRQFEWYDYFASALVLAALEQLALLVEQERLLRRLWAKKLLPFVSCFISSENLHSQVPLLDVSVSGGQLANMGLDFVIERHDITNYIAQLKLEPKFVELLTREYRELVALNNLMTKMNRLLSLITTISHDVTEWSDADAQLMKGLKLRVKKLESLLHQHQYKNLLLWPVSQRMTKTSPPPAQPLQALVLLNSDPTQLLKRHSLPAPNERLDGLVIDKHLHNIRLRRANDELSLTNSSLVKTQAAHQHTIDDINRRHQKALDELLKRHQEEMAQMQLVFERERQELVDEQATLIGDHTKKIRALEQNWQEAQLDSKLDKKEIESLQKKLDSRDKKIHDLEVAAATERQVDWKSQYEAAEARFKEASAKCDAIEAKHLVAIRKLEGAEPDSAQVEEYRMMNKELMENMAAKDAEFSRERGHLEEEIRQLEVRGEEVEDMLEIIADLNNIVLSLAGKLRRSLNLGYSQFIEMCFILELMGLLLIHEDEYYRITRVKGLRSMQEDGEPTTEVAKILRDLVAKLMDQLGQLDKFKLVTPQHQGWSGVRDQSLALIQEFNSVFGPQSVLDWLVQRLEFKENVKLQDDEADTRFFVNAIAKRFRDVEGFAKRQTKENKQKQLEINRMVTRLNNKILMSLFVVGDLVLFLPTRIEKSSIETAPWAAFNIGSPHYFLQGQGDGEWMVGRVEQIDEHKVTTENCEDSVANPFLLSVGVVWYMVRAQQQYS